MRESAHGVPSQRGLERRERFDESRHQPMIDVLELRAVEQALAVAHADETADAHAGGEHLAELHHRFEIIDGYSARARAAALLSGLGFSAARHDDPVSTFSGGWRS